MFKTRRDSFHQILNEVGRVQDEVNRMIGHFADRYGWGVKAQPAGPALNLWEDENAFYVETDLPGMDPSKLEVTVTEGTKLTVSGERLSDDVKDVCWHRQERAFGQFRRELTLPVLVDADKVSARFEQGVLKLTLPKSEAAKPRRINVQGV